MLKDMDVPLIATQVITKLFITTQVHYDPFIISILNQQLKILMAFNQS